MANSKKLASEVMPRKQQVLEKAKTVTQIRLGGESEDGVLENVQAKDLFQYLTEHTAPMGPASRVISDFHQGSDIIATARKELTGDLD